MIVLRSFVGESEHALVANVLVMGPDKMPTIHKVRRMRHEELQRHISVFRTLTLMRICTENA